MAKIHSGWWAATACAGVLVICGAVLLGMIRERLVTLLGSPPDPIIGRDRMRRGGSMQIIEAAIGEKRWIRATADHTLVGLSPGRSCDYLLGPRGM